MGTKDHDRGRPPYEPEEIPGIDSSGVIPDADLADLADLWEDSTAQPPEPPQPPAQLASDTRVDVGSALYGDGDYERTDPGWIPYGSDALSPATKAPDTAEKVTENQVIDAWRQWWKEGDGRYRGNIDAAQMLFDVIRATVREARMNRDVMIVECGRERFAVPSRHNYQNIVSFFNNTGNDPSAVGRISDLQLCAKVDENDNVLTVGRVSLDDAVAHSSAAPQAASSTPPHAPAAEPVAHSMLALPPHAIEPAEVIPPPARPVVMPSRSFPQPQARPAQPKAHEVVKSSRRVYVEFDPAKFKINIPPFSRIYFRSAASDWKSHPDYEMTTPAGGTIPTFTGDIPAEKFSGDELEYKFFVQLPSGDGFWLPPGGPESNLRCKALPPPAKPSATSAPVASVEKKSDPYQDTPEEAVARKKAEQYSQRFKNKREAERDRDFVDAGNGEIRPKPGFRWVGNSEGSLNFAVRLESVRDSEKTHGDGSAETATSLQEPEPMEKPKPRGKGKWLKRTLLGLGGAAVLAGGAIGIARNSAAPPAAAADTTGDSTGTQDNAEGVPLQNTKPKENTLTVTAKKFVDPGTGRITIKVTTDDGTILTYADYRTVKLKIGDKSYEADTSSLTMESSQKLPLKELPAQ